MMEIDVFTDIKNLEKVFRELPRAMQRKAYSRSLRAGASIVRDAAKENVKAITSNEATGTLANNLSVYNLKKYRGWYRVGVRVKKGAVNKKKKDGQGNPVRVGLYGAVLEYGKKGQTPKSWIRKAIRENKDNSLNAISAEMKKRMNEAIEDAKK